MNYSQYSNKKNVPIINRNWPNNTITEHPEWCSVDLRDGNQSLPIPMTEVKKFKLFNLLKNIGFKHIEIGYPTSSSVEYDFINKIVNDEKNSDIKFKILVPCIADHISKAVECVGNNKNVIYHLYNSTSPIQRKHVFNKNENEIIELALNSVKLLKTLNPDANLQYSPESFTATEIDFSIKICKEISNTWGKKIIFNLPSTVELFSPNIYADYIEFFKNEMKNYPHDISIHTHNDRGTAIASAELALMAGASIVEGTLFGNGERAGNCDLITMALNIHTSGIDCGLDFSDLDHIEKIYTECTGMVVHERHPYAGKFFLTAFSGTHQDAINKTFNKCNDPWKVPYLPINPSDIGKEFNIRINSQSGKGGISFILKQYFDISLPTNILKEFSIFVNGMANNDGELLEITTESLSSLLQEFIKNKFKLKHSQNIIFDNHKEDKICNISKKFNIDIRTYSQHSLEESYNSPALTIIQGIYKNKNFEKCFIANNINESAIKCLISVIDE